MPGDPVDHFDEGDDVDDDAVGADDEVDHNWDDDEGGEAALTFCRFCFCFCKFILLQCISAVAFVKNEAELLDQVT